LKELYCLALPLNPSEALLNGKKRWEERVRKIYFAIQPTPDGGYITSGLTYSNDGDVKGYHGGTEADAWIVKLGSSGAIQRQKVSAGSTGCDFANAILSTPDGGYVIVGHTDSHDGDVTSTAEERDVWIVKLLAAAVLVYGRKR
jgi:hypothetical protein